MIAKAESGLLLPRGEVQNQTGERCRRAGVQWEAPLAQEGLQLLRDQWTSPLKPQRLCDGEEE